MKAFAQITALAVVVAAVFVAPASAQAASVQTPLTVEAPDQLAGAGRVQVGCRLVYAPLRSCTARLYVAPAPGRALIARQVLIGSATVSLARMQVGKRFPVRLNARGRRYLAQQPFLSVRVVVSARTASGGRYLQGQRQMLVSR